MKGELMKDGLEQAYEMMVESNKEGTVTSNIKPGSAAMGDLKKASAGGPEKTNVKKPEEGESKINPGHGKIKTEASQKRELSKMLPESRFDVLYKRQLVSEGEIESDESPLEMSGDEGFDDERGDFPPTDGDDTSEEVDVATEIRLIIDRLSEIAEKLGAYDADAEEADDSVGELGMDDELGIDDESGFPESVQAKLTPLKNSVSTMQSRANKVKSNFTANSKKASNTGGPGKGAADGKLSAFRKTTFGPKTSQKADVKGPMGKPGAGIFDNV